MTTHSTPNALVLYRLRKAAARRPYLKEARAALGRRKTGPHPCPMCGEEVKTGSAIDCCDACIMQYQKRW